PLFGRVIARNCAPILDALQTSTIVEYGPGSGALADAVIGWFAERERSLDYRLVEVSPDLAARQRARLEHWTQQPQITLDWFDDPTTQTIRGVVLGNEVADALPVRRFRRTATGFDELGLAADGDALRIAERSAPSTVAADLAALEQRRGSPFPPGYTSEYCPALANWVTAVVRTVDAGLVLLCDYGAGASEYYADERYDGTFRCHFRHQAIDDPLFAPGLVDMTAWVDFTTLA
ncbi:MAG: class I SAM-dependent methyltransferase, partial [Pseudomonadota bacterium]